MNIGARILTLLKQNGMTQRELANEIGVTETSISRYISGQRVPKANIVGFTKPSQALAFFRENPVALAFLDIELGRTSGLELCREILQIRPRTNVIYLTAFREYAFDAWGTGACGFLLKPLETETVRAQLSCLRYPVKGLL